MNIGLIAHDSKKKLMQNFFVLRIGGFCVNTHYMQQVLQED